MIRSITHKSLETNTNIRVNTINPGGTRTGMRSSALPGEDPASLPTPEQIIPLYLYLMGADGRSIHGQSLNAQETQFPPAA